MRDGKIDRTIKYEIRKIDDLLEKVIPHFEQYPLLSSKQNDFRIFKEVCLLMKKNEHVTSKGLSKVIHIAFKMNASGRRRYTQEDILMVMRTQMKV